MELAKPGEDHVVSRRGGALKLAGQCDINRFDSHGGATPNWYKSSKFLSKILSKIFFIASQQVQSLQPPPLATPPEI